MGAARQTCHGDPATHPFRECTKFGGHFDDANIAAKAAQFTNFTALGVTRATASLGLGVDGDTIRSTKTQAIGGAHDTKDGVVAVTV